MRQEVFGIVRFLSVRRKSNGWSSGQNAVSFNGRAKCAKDRLGGFYDAEKLLRHPDEEPYG
jgi:hypothetical protein